LRLFQFYTRDDVTGMRFPNFVELFALHHVQRAETFHNSARGVERVRISLKMTADNLENVYAACKWIGDGSEAVSREWLAVAVLASDTLRIRTGIDRLAPLSFMVRRIGCEVYESVEQCAQTDLRDTRDCEHRTVCFVRSRC